MFAVCFEMDIIKRRVGWCPRSFADTSGVMSTFFLISPGVFFPEIKTMVAQSRSARHPVLEASELKCQALHIIFW